MGLIGGTPQQRNTKDLNAVHRDDAREFLSNIGVLDKVENDEVECEVCGEVIGVDNIGSLKKTDGEYRFICDKISCIKKW